MSQSLRLRAFKFGLALCMASALAPVARAETLADAIADAYRTNPQLQAQRATQRALDETYVQARAGWRPTLNLVGRAEYDESHTRPFALQGFGSPINRSNTGLLEVNFSQNIWTGGRTAAAVSAANSDVLQGREQLRQIEAQVMQAVVTSYADVLRDQQNVLTQQQYEGLVAQQLREDQARFDVGEVTRTDVAQSQSRLASAQAQLQSAQAQLAVDRSTYAALVGHNPGQLAPLPSLAFLMPTNADEAFNFAEQNSPQLRAQEYAEQSSRARIAEARAGRMPNVTFNAFGGYGNAPIAPFDYRLYQRQAQAQFTVTIPIFNGGTVTSQIRQEIERNNSDRISVETQRRAVLQTITQSWNQLLAARANISATDEQVRAAKVAYEGMHEEEQAGLRSTLDVLIAAQDFASASLSQATAHHDEYVLSAAMLATMGRLEARDLIPSEPQYDPAANFRRLRITWGWVPWEEPIGVMDRYIAYPMIPQAHDLPKEPAIGHGLEPRPATSAAAPAAAAPAPATTAPAAPPPAAPAPATPPR